jgi:HD-GYP domain-containing protein (c-di-GMP phosphodiesterase class II)
VALNPGYQEQQLLATALDRRTARLSPRERIVHAVLGVPYLAVVAALLLTSSAGDTVFSPVAAACALVAFLFASVTEFDTESGVAVPTQLAFVPLLFALPPAGVLIAVPATWACAKLPEALRGGLRPSRLLAAIGNSWFAVGPVLVLQLAGVAGIHDATPLVLIAALLAQFACDAGAAAVREALLRGTTLRERVAELWICAVDAALAPVGLVVVWAMDDIPWSAAALLPLIGVIAVFARERRRRVESLVELNNAYQGMALVLGDVVEHDDGYTGEHCRDVVALALAVGERLGLSADRRRNLEFAALLHDVGKVAIPKSIINKPGRLDPDEFELIKTHAVEGQRMLDRVGGFMSDVGLIVRWHHERWDGRGYPDGIAGGEIPLEARIITCCDSYNAMTTTRSYRAALPVHVAAQELRDCAGSQFDPAVVEAVLAVLDVEPSPAAAVLGLAAA